MLKICIGRQGLFQVKIPAVKKKKGKVKLSSQQTIITSKKHFVKCKNQSDTKIALKRFSLFVKKIVTYLYNAAKKVVTIGGVHRPLKCASNE